MLDGRVGDAGVARAAEMLRRGELVAFPTETVYGLGASLRAPEAILKLFEAKGRPASVPLIAHVTGWAQASELVAEPPSDAVMAMLGELWPGPLTVVVTRSHVVPDSATGGRDTVGIRAPAHPVARALLRELGCPVFAPSANRFGSIPPVTGEQVFRGLQGRIEAVLDAGRCSGGLESTVVDITQSPAKILRPGAVDRVEIERFLKVQDAPGAQDWNFPKECAPERWLCVVSPGKLRVAAAAAGSDKRVAIVLCGGEAPVDLAESVEAVFVLPEEPAEYASKFYNLLHELRHRGVTRVLVEALPAQSAWAGVWARVQRIAGSVQTKKHHAPMGAGRDGRVGT